MSLLITGRTDMGLYPDGSVLSDPLGIGTILDCVTSHRSFTEVHE